MLAVLVLSGAMMCGCGGGGGASSGTTTTTTTPPVTAATPTITTTAALNGASIATIADSTAGATIYFTLDGSTPTTASQVYQAPFLISSSMTVNAIAAASGDTTSAVASKAFSPGIPSGTLVWSDEFTNSGSANAQPNPLVWAWETGNNSGWGNSELEYYCPWGSNTSPCNSASPNSYVAPGGGLNIVAEQPSAGVYTSARMKTQGLFSFMYGRIEAKIWVPESQGMWPAFWALGNNITTESWPACGELDIMEHIDGSNPQSLGYDWTQATIHQAPAVSDGTPYHPSGFTAAAWHTYGMIWKQGEIQFYVDDPTNPYETFTSTTTTGTWAFDQGPQFILLNLAVGGSWPGNPDSTTVFPGTMKVDYVRIYSN